MIDKCKLPRVALAWLLVSAAVAARAAHADSGPESEPDSSSRAVAAAHGAAEAIDFNRDIRPILSENCFYCHGQDANKREADLRLDVRAAAIEAGAIVPGDAGASGIVERILSDDPEMQMPPPKSNRRLTAEQKKLLQRWIADGAEYLEHWAFTAPVRPVPPDEPEKPAEPADIATREHQSSAESGPWSRSPIDRFIAARLPEVGLAPSPEADRATLIKRLAIDLTGLPPAPEEIEAFVSDKAPDAYERLVDRYLSKPGYGERQS
ncbi:MAG: DUF1549 domain-containing protein, partial [Aureliella sp.]